MKQDGTKADLLQVKDNVFKSAPYLSRIRLIQIMTNPFSGLQNHVSLRHRWGQLRSVGSCHALQRRILRDLVLLLQKQGHYNSGVSMDMYGYSFYVSILPLHTFAASITTREIRDGCTAAQLCLLFALTKSSFIDFRRLASSCA